MGPIYINSSEREVHMVKSHWIDCQNIKWNMSHPYLYSYIIGFFKINGVILNVEGGATLFPLQFIYEE